ncbi:hypothetical protein K0M31_006681 [Melipona bicolor]|uniref:Uncharacterized protein n=1 Tax=Melipona bicolor TaxID=60889 RepID=A0AA40FS19_9HYME|nr:hypothetical protein K0M31_006681 [Melipona bicolor]
MARRWKRSGFSNLRAVIGNKNTVITAFDIVRIINCKLPVRSPSQTRNNETGKSFTSLINLRIDNLITINRSIISTYRRGKGSKANDVDPGNRTLHFDHAGSNYRISDAAYTMALNAIMRDYRRGHCILRKNLKITILVTNIITGFITTLMITIADRYDIPYLYLPWLVNTMKGIALCEGPALLSLANVLLPSITLPTATFIFITFFLYVEQLYIWNNVFIKFQHCWENYHNEKHSDIEKTKEKLFTTRNKKLMCQNNVKNGLNTGVEKLKSDKKPIEFCDNINKQISTEIRLRPIKNATKDNNNFIQNQLLDITG